MAALAPGIRGVAAAADVLGPARSQSGSLLFIFDPAPSPRWAVVGVEEVASLATEPAVIASGSSFKSVSDGAWHCWTKTLLGSAHGGASPVRHAQGSRLSDCSSSNRATSAARSARRATTLGCGRRPRPANQAMRRSIAASQYFAPSSVSSDGGRRRNDGGGSSSNPGPVSEVMLSSFIAAHPSGQSSATAGPSISKTWALRSQSGYAGCGMWPGTQGASSPPAAV